MDVGGGRKRLRDASEPRITYHTASRTFDRLFKEESLNETKEVVRRKLGLPETAVIQLAQLRAGQVIDLEDDDDFDAFYSVAHSSTSVDVRVTILSTPPTQASTLPQHPSLTSRQNHVSPPSPSRDHDVSMSDATDANTRKRKVTFVDVSPATAQVVPPKKRRMSTSKTSIQLESNFVSVTSGITSGTQVSSTDSSESTPNTNATAPNFTHEETSNAQTDSAIANHDFSPQSDDASTATQRKSKKLKKAGEAVEDDSESLYAAQSSEPQTSLNDRQFHDDSSKKKRKKKKKEGTVSDITSGPLVSTSGEVEPSAEINPKSDAKLEKKKKQTSLPSSSKFTKQLAEMITNSTKSPESQSSKDSNRDGPKANESEPRKSKANTDTEAGVDSRPSDNKAKGKAAASKRKKGPDSSISETATQPKKSLTEDRSLEVEFTEGGKTKRKKKKKMSDAGPPTPAADLAAAAETLKALSMRVISRVSGLEAPSNSVGPRNAEDGSTQKHAMTTLGSENAILELSNNQAASKEAQRVKAGDNTNASVTNVKPMSIPSIPSQDEPSHAGPILTSLSNDDSSDDDAITVAHNTNSSQRPLNVPFSDIDLETLLRGPRRERLTVDEALSIKLHSLSKESHKVVLEEDEVIQPKRRCSSIAMAVPSDSDEHDMASDSASDDDHLALSYDRSHASVQSLPNPPEADSLSSNDAITADTLGDVAATQGSKPDSTISMIGDFHIDVPTVVQDEVQPPSPIQDQDPIEPEAITLRTTSPIEDINDMPQVARRPGLRRRGNEKIPPKASTQPPPPRKSAKVVTQLDLISEPGVRASDVKMTRSRSKQMASASHTSNSPLSSTRRPVSVPTEKFSGMPSAVVSSQQPAEGAHLGSSNAIFDVPLGEWATLKGSSPPVDVETSAMIDEIHSTPDHGEIIYTPDVPESAGGEPNRPSGAKSSLFVGSASREEFPYSQWQDLDEMGPSPSGPPRIVSPAADDSEDENEVEASIMSQDTKKHPGHSYRRLTDIASQRCLFSTPTLSQHSGKSDSAKTTKGMYGALGTAYDDSSDSDDDSDGVEPSHIPRSRRAGSKKIH